MHCQQRHRFGFTCRPGYIPDETTPGTAATGLHCRTGRPSARRAEQKNGAAASPAAIAIDWFGAAAPAGRTRTGSTICANARHPTVTSTEAA